MHLKKLSKSTNSSVQTSPAQANPAIGGIKKFSTFHEIRLPKKTDQDPPTHAKAGWIKAHPLRTIDVNLHEYRVSN
ncbi:MAG: hypothetical protein WBJ45_04020 [Limnohabitans sp.]|jgi:hypothetical protein|uniref:hypothetical protein n=1 Tax=Limnohabitans sp. TaxID=1907725 RepID=UPI003BB1E816